MSRGLSLHVGLNAVSPASYGGWAGELIACENDAYAMRNICQGSGCDVRTLLTKNATLANVMGAIEDAARQLEKDDLFVLSFSCHGGEVPDYWEPMPTGKQTQTICLYDGELIDHQLYEMWGKFKPGVRIFMLADSCHSGTVARYTPKTARPKFMPREIRLAIGTPNLPNYGQPIPPRPLAGVIHLGACQDNQSAMDGEKNGLFTAKLLQVWNSRKFRGTYHSFLRQIMEKMPAYQRPSYLELGGVSGEFRRSKPFII